ncbi:Uncharacterised protein [Candidatus Burarchaeum australiense]|nr:Uncharacterised protein [Candidatus Burarchaeum australiense]
MLCPTCYTESGRRQTEKNALCTRCGIYIPQREANLELGTTLCKKCCEEVRKNRRERYCASCGKFIEGASFEKPDGTRLCIRCMHDQSPGGSGGRRHGVRVCDRCGRMAVISYVSSEGTCLCMNCAPSHTGRGILKYLTDAINNLRR